MGGRSSRNDLACMERAIFFEANRSSRTGMVAVGNVVMNRVASDDFPDTVCGVVGQKNQFAPGVMTRKMNSKALPEVREAAVAALRGERAPGIGRARFFHTYGYRFPYDNMHYTLTAGGNAFYEKRKSHLVTQRVPLPPIDGIGR
ncbi:cell wall hydrolase [Paracoccus sp. M683]|uniref:cell wall hydrolase n=1 Tax=Paracoccus sp. M683 TaxID=2594268 RepID=UPI002102DD7A|nr:cell wall hydrolase [Paracoccus sp. M683]